MCRELVRNILELNTLLKQLWELCDVLTDLLGSGSSKVSQSVVGRDITSLSAYEKAQR